jgi:hypothetical protein
VFQLNTYSNFPLSISGSILAGNAVGGGGADDLEADPHSTLTVNYSLIGVADGLSFTGNVGNLTGTAASPLDPQLAPLDDNGGTTQTHAVTLDSFAFNRGDPSILFNAGEFDQRGTPFTRVSGGRVDIGAFEVQISPPALPGDYNLDEIVDAADYVVWRKTSGQVGLMPYSGADGSGDGEITDTDYGVWQLNFGATIGGAAASGEQGATAEDLHSDLLPGGGDGAIEPVALGAAALAFSAPAVDPAQLDTTPATFAAEVNSTQGIVLAVFGDGDTRHDSAPRPNKRINTSGTAESASENVLLLLANDRNRLSSRHAYCVFDDHAMDDEPCEDVDSQGLADEPLAVALAEWR